MLQILKSVLHACATVSCRSVSSSTREMSVLPVEFKQLGFVVQELERSGGVEGGGRIEMWQVHAGYHVVTWSCGVSSCCPNEGAGRKHPKAEEKGLIEMTHEMHDSVLQKRFCLQSCGAEVTEPANEHPTTVTGCARDDFGGVELSVG